MKVEKVDIIYSARILQSYEMNEEESCAINTYNLRA
jgi:hypothetical protein